MNEGETIDSFLRWFGYRVFKISDIPDDRIDELLADFPDRGDDPDRQEESGG